MTDAAAAQFADHLALALDLADLADAATLPRFQALDLRVELKADATEVSEADRAAESAVRARLAEVRPGHAVLGEEQGLIGDEASPWRWVIDPIDATANYVRGIPAYATLIALLHHGVPVVGVCSAPALGRRWWAARGTGAFARTAGGEARPVRVSSVDDLAKAHLGHASIGTWDDHGMGDGFVALTRAVWRSRGFGDFWMHVLVAEGAMDAALEPIVSLWDVAAIQVIVEEAGGRFTTTGGEPRADGGSAVSSNGLLHDAVLAHLAPRR